MIERAGRDDFCCAAKCGHGGIGRHAGLRIQWETMQVRILLSAPEKDDKADLIRQSSFLCPVFINNSFPNGCSMIATSITVFQYKLKNCTENVYDGQFPFYSLV
jgi:hypothetical protein